MDGVAYAMIKGMGRGSALYRKKDPIWTRTMKMRSGIALAWP